MNVEDRYSLMLVKISLGWIWYKGEIYYAQPNYHATVKAKKPMLDLSECATQAFNNNVLMTVQFDKSKFKTNIHMNRQTAMFDMPMTIHKRENTEENQTYLDENKLKLSKQCQKVWDILSTGKRLTVRDAIITYHIGDLRRRIKDLKDQGYCIDSLRLDGGSKEYFKT